MISPQFVTHPWIVLRMEHPDVVGLNALVEEVESKNPGWRWRSFNMAGNINDEDQSDGGEYREERWWRCPKQLEQLIMISKHLIKTNSKPFT